MRGSGVRIPLSAPSLSLLLLFSLGLSKEKRRKYAQAHLFVLTRKEKVNDIRECEARLLSFDVGSPIFFDLAKKEVVISGSEAHVLFFFYSFTIFFVVVRPCRTY